MMHFVDVFLQKSSLDVGALYNILAGEHLIVQVISTMKISSFCICALQSKLYIITINFHCADTLNVTLQSRVAKPIMFSIDVSISTSSNMWDLAKEKDFTVTLGLTLPEHMGSPTTCRNSKAGLFNRRLGEHGSGLIYKSLGENGSVLELGRTFICSFGGRPHQPLPLNKGINETAFTTFYPGGQ